MKLFLDLQKVKNLLHIGLEKNDECNAPTVLTPGAKYLEMAKRLQDEAGTEHADPLAVKALMVISTRPARMSTFFPRSFAVNKPLMLYEHGFN